VRWTGQRCIEVQWPNKPCVSGVTAVVVGQSQRFCSGVGFFNWCCLSSPPQIPRRPGFGLESKGGETQTQVGAGVREDCLRELLGSGRTKSCALQWRSQNCSQARAWNSPSPSNHVFVTASYFGSANGIFCHFLNQWHRFKRGSRKQIITAPVERSKIGWGFGVG
jgi:hypothetical protein